ncbi:sensor histidine kinase [Shuttleworthella satelles]|uniref:histidine kinase n=1 Tax=Shuttleworthella satelles DSM 14600 TaxID=626523 RepID=C4GB77_9FIRM|nr:sensor histidine kinase [Shuttleworthia satelles]EEP28370.1 ATPase/histidine kinase/DNA gyrase B/HSP90 domain protein [Shuttleworthia satelles DSM 14600]
MPDKKEILDFLREILPVTTSLLLVVILLATVSMLGGMENSYMILCVQIIVFSWLIYLVFASYHIRRRTDLSRELERIMKEKRQLEEETLQRQKDLEDYFLLWMHQMKTPITAASLLLESDSMSCDSNAIRIKSRLMEINGYANMAMSYLKLMQDSNDMDLTRVKLKPLVTEILKRYSLLFVENDDRIEIDIPRSAYVLSDARGLSVLVEQLISNAVKYTRGGKILICYDLGKKALRVEDTGAGIPAQDLPKIFDRGYSGFNGRATDKSSGLGLFLVDTIARKLSLKIAVESKVGEGSCFTVLFP